MSANMVPAGTVTRCEFSPEFTAWTKASSFLCILLLTAEGDYVHSHIVLLELLAHLDQFILYSIARLRRIALCYAVFTGSSVSFAGRICLKQGTGRAELLTRGMLASLVCSNQPACHQIV